MPVFSTNRTALTNRRLSRPLRAGSPGGWAPLVGTELSCCALIGGPPYDVTNVETVEVLP